MVIAPTLDLMKIQKKKGCASLHRKTLVEFGLMMCRSVACLNKKGLLMKTNRLDAMINNSKPSLLAIIIAWIFR